MAITINKDIIKMGQRGGKTDLTVTYTGGGTYMTPSIMYFIPTIDVPAARTISRNDGILEDKFIHTNKGVIEFDHKIKMDGFEIVDEYIDGDDPEIEYGGTINPGTSVNIGGWLTVDILEEVEQDVVEYEVNISPYEASNNEISSRMAAIIFSDSTGNKGIVVRQTDGFLSIWQNYLYDKDYVEGQKYEYELMWNGNAIYKGISVALNDWSLPLPINIPRLCESTLETNRFSINDGWNDLGGTSVIDMYHGDELVEAFYFCNDWSGRKLIYNSDSILNDPINGHLAAGMYVPLCIYNANDSEDWYVISDYGGGNVQEDLMGIPAYNFDSYTVTVPAGLQEMIFYNSVESGIRIKYDATHCGPGYFIYRNRYGAWDVFLIEGNIYENENYTRDNHSIGNMDNAWDTWVKITNRISISKNYTASTGWLTDEQAEKLVYHLMGSPEVYYQPFGGDMVAVNLTDNQAEIKKFRNGRRLIQYNINFEESKTRRVNR